MGKKGREERLGKDYKEERQFKAFWDDYLRWEYVSTATYHFNKLMRGA